MTKKILSIFLVTLMMVSIFSFSVSAASSKTVSLSGNRGWSSSVTCTLKKNIWGKSKSGTVRATIPNWGVNVDIRMCNGGRVIWSENNAIRGNNRTDYTYRNFNLGNNYKYYNLSFRCSKNCSVAPYVTVKNIKNVNIS